MIFKKIEQVLKKAREQDHVCEFCYYEVFDDRAYPCSRCVCNMPTESMWRPKPRAYGKKTDAIVIDESGGGYGIWTYTGCGSKLKGADDE